MTGLAARLGVLVLLACLAQAGPAGATVYYVDAANGRDETSGLSEREAWRSLARVSRADLRPGDQVLFRRGGIWRGRLTPPASGAPGRPIVFGAYGQGDLPSLRGSDVLEAASWQRVDDTTWYHGNVNQDPRFLVVDNRPVRRVPDMAGLREPWDFHYDHARKRVYLRSDRNPATAAKIVEAPAREYVIRQDRISHVIFRGLDFRHALRLTWLGWSGGDVTFEGCRLIQSGENHLQFHEGFGPGVVRQCLFDDWNLNHVKSYAIQAIGKQSGPIDVEGCRFLATTPGGGDDHTAIMNDEDGWVRSVRRCSFEGGGRLKADGVVIWHPARKASEVIIEDNVFEGIGGVAIIIQELEFHGAAPRVVVRRNSISGVCLNDDLDKEALRLRAFGSRSQVEVADNFIDGVKKGRHPHEGIGLTAATGARVHNNTVRGAENGVSLREVSKNVTIRANLLLDNHGHGIKVGPGSTAEAAGNCLHGNKAGAVTGMGAAGNLVADPRLDKRQTPAVDGPCPGVGARLQPVR